MVKKKIFMTGYGLKDPFLKLGLICIFMNKDLRLKLPLRYIVIIGSICATFQRDRLIHFLMPNLCLKFRKRG